MCLKSRMSHLKLRLLNPEAAIGVFTGPAGNSPQIDYMVITPAEIVPNLYTITANAGEGGIISGRRGDSTH